MPLKRDFQNIKEDGLAPSVDGIFLIFSFAMLNVVTAFMVICLKGAEMIVLLTH